LWLVEAGEETAGERVAPHELELCRICRLCDIPGLERCSRGESGRSFTWGVRTISPSFRTTHDALRKKQATSSRCSGKLPGSSAKLKRRKQSDHNYREYRRRIASHGHQLRAKRLRRESPSRIWCVEQLETAALSPMPAVQWWRSGWCSRLGLEPALR